MLPHVFELFMQADHAVSKSQGGLGIGLTLVKSLIEMLGGTVEAHSQGIGFGSEFVIRSPLATTHDNPPIPIQLRATGRRRRHEQYRLLVVDDNADAANSLGMILRMKGHQVRIAHNGHAALELTELHHPDMIFLDIGMPGMDGYEVAPAYPSDDEQIASQFLRLLPAGANQTTDAALPKPALTII